MKNLLLLPLIIFLAACSKNIIVEREPNVAIEKYKTYHWNVLEASKNTDPFYNNEILNRQLEQAIEDNLAKKGMVQVKTKPDFLVDFHVYVVEKRIQDYYCPTGYYRGNRFLPELLPSPGCENPISMVSYDDGTLIIDIVDAASKKVVWRGSYNNLINDKSQVKPIFLKQVGAILDKLPVKNQKKEELPKNNSKIISKN